MKVKKVGARMRRVGRGFYQVSSQRQVALSRETMLVGGVVEQFLVETAGAARLRKGDVILRRVR